MLVYWLVDTYRVSRALNSQQYETVEYNQQQRHQLDPYQISDQPQTDGS